MNKKIEFFSIKLNSEKSQLRKRLKATGVIVLMFSVLGFSFAFDRVDRARADSGEVLSSVTVGNSAPTIAGTVLKMTSNSTPIVLLEDATVSVSVVGTITDINGDADIDTATATIYLTSVSGGQDCSASDVDCYQITSGSCTLAATNGDNDRDVTCTTEMWFLATRSDDDGETWTGALTAYDGTDYSASGTDTEEVNTLQALKVSASIAYGTESAEATTTIANQKIVYVTTTGNDALDVTIQATDDMCQTDEPCTGDQIASTQQQYTTNSNLEYQDSGDSFPESIQLASSSAKNFNLASATPTTHGTHYGNTSNESDISYWKIGIPSGQAAGTYNGTTTVTSKANSNETDL